MREISAGALLLLVSLAPSPAVAADYYVAATGGSNGNTGLIGSPWATLQYAAGVVMPGDVVHALAGNHVGFNLGRSGTAAKPIRFVAEPGAAITQRNGVTTDGINVEGADYVVIDGFTINSMPRAGVRCALSRFVVIRKIHADLNGRWGIFTGCCPDLTVEDNVTSRSVAEHGIYVSNSADRPIIRRNVSFSNNANGIHMNGDLSIDCGGITTQDGVISGATVEQNVLYDNGVAGGSGINCDGVADSVIRNNLIYNTHASGISLYQIDAGAPATNNRVTHNTVVVASNGRWALNIADGSTGNFVRNNILLTNHTTRGAIVISADSRQGFSSDYNVLTARNSPDGDTTVLNLASWQALGYDTNSVSSTPAAVFVNQVSDFHLSGTSPAIDKGETASGAAVDLEGNARPAGLGHDVGAYERNAVAPPDGGTQDLAPLADLTVAPGADLMSPPGDMTHVAGADLTAMSGGDMAGIAVIDAAGDGPVGTAASGCGCHLGARRDAPLAFGLLALGLALVGLALRSRRRAA